MKEYIPVLKRTKLFAGVYRAVMLVRHAEDEKKYLYDILEIKKETSSPPMSEDDTV